MPRFLIDLPMPLDPTDRLENFLQKAAASPLNEDPVVQAAVGRVQGYLRDRQASTDAPRQESPG
nr:hypothetical protein [uncultured Rhodopila sp.]